MRTNIHQAITNVLDENRSVIRTTTHETYVLYPDNGKKLKNKKTGFILEGYVCLRDNASIEDYEEVDE